MASSVAAPLAVRSKPRLTFWEIWNMSFGFLGIQIGFALQNANVSRIFETLGAKVENIPILWIAAPVTGLLVQPIIGYLSDRTWNRLGRRRPYFLDGRDPGVAALLVMPNSPALWVAAGMLWVMDASINISMEPFRAFVGDNLPSEQRTTGFAMQSFFIGMGAVVAVDAALAADQPVRGEQQGAPARSRTRCACPSTSAAWSSCWRCCGRCSARRSTLPRRWRRSRKTRRARGSARSGGRRAVRPERRAAGPAGAILLVVGVLLSAWLAARSVYQVYDPGGRAGVVGLLLIAGGCCSGAAGTTTASSPS